MEIFIPFVKKDRLKTILDFLYCGQIRRFIGAIYDFYNLAANDIWMDNTMYIAINAVLQQFITFW